MEVIMTKRDKIIATMRYAYNAELQTSPSQGAGDRAWGLALLSIEALGYAIVPTEPTEGMLTNSGAIEGFNGFAEEGDVDRCHIEWWETMIEQAQKEMEI